jgi:hypothetical protein
MEMDDDTAAALAYLAADAAEHGDTDTLESLQGILDDPGALEEVLASDDEGGAAADMAELFPGYDFSGELLA